VASGECLGRWRRRGREWRVASGECQWRRREASGVWRVATRSLIGDSARERPGEWRDSEASLTRRGEEWQVASGRPGPGRATRIIGS
jgi:hypothetical protein